MDICSDKHPEIVYDERVCPLCDEKEDRAIEVEMLEKEVSDLRKEIQDA